MSDDVRRHPDGSIDFDFYRAEAVQLRRQALRDALRSANAGTSVMAGALGFAIVIPSSSAHMPAGRLAALVTSHLR